MARKGGAPENLKPQKAGEPSINPHGRPKKLVNQILGQLKDAGVEGVTKGQLIELYAVLLNLDAETLRNLSKNTEAPIIVRITGEFLLDPDNRLKALTDVRNWLFGSGNSTIELTGKDGAPLAPFVWEKFYKGDTPTK